MSDLPNDRGGTRRHSDIQTRHVFVNKEEKSEMKIGKLKKNVIYYKSNVVN